MRFLFLLAASSLFGQAPLREDATVPMRDGVRLAATIYRPSAPGRYPVLVVRTPYNRAGAKGAATALAEQGFAVVAQDVRGRFESPGDFYAFLNEGPDGYDTIEWAAAQRWSNGKVGTFGASYLAWDQFYAAQYKPPHLASMYMIVGGSNFYQDFAFPGGTPNLGWSVWLARSAQTSPLANEKKEAAEKFQIATRDLTTWAATHPQERSKSFESFPPHLKMFTDYYSHPNFDSYWKHRGFYYESLYKEIKDVPSLFLSGWYDYFGEGTLKNFTAVHKTQKTEKKLIMGPWPHGTGRAVCGDVAFGDAATANEVAMMADWFRHTLYGERLKLIRNETVSVFRMGGGSGERTSDKFQHGGKWLTYSTWPAPAKNKVLYLGAGGKLVDSVPAAATITYVFDPDNPVPTLGGRYGIPGTPDCAQDQRPLKDRSDIVRFETAPLDADLDVTGMVRARLTVSTDAKDTDFTAKLIDVYPSGYELILADSQIRLRFRKGFEKPAPYTPGSKTEVAIDLGSISNLFVKGHKLRLDVSSSNYPKFEPNPGTGEDAGTYTKRVKATNSVYLGSSRLELPVVSR